MSVEQSALRTAQLNRAFVRRIEISEPSIFMAKYFLNIVKIPSKESKNVVDIKT